MKLNAKLILNHIYVNCTYFYLQNQKLH